MGGGAEGGNGKGTRQGFWTRSKNMLLRLVFNSINFLVAKSCPKLWPAFSKIRPIALEVLSEPVALAKLWRQRAALYSSSRYPGFFGTVSIWEPRSRLTFRSPFGVSKTTVWGGRQVSASFLQKGSTVQQGGEGVANITRKFGAILHSYCSNLCTGYAVALLFPGSHLPLW